MKVLIHNTAFFKNIIESVKDLVQKGTLVFKKSPGGSENPTGPGGSENPENGLVLETLDISSVSLCKLVLRPEFFQLYEVERDISIGLSFTELAKILKCIDSTDQIELSHDDSKDELVIISSKADSKKRKSKFTLSLLNIDSDPLSIPELEPDCSFVCNSKEFKTITSGLSEFGEDCIFSIKKDQNNNSNFDLVLKSKSTLSKSLAEYNINSLEQLKSTKNQIRIIFSLLYLVSFNKCSGLCDKVKVEIFEDQPMNMLFNFEHGYIRHYLAPKSE
jgi:proliferating cell nuclear antigen PCNA